MADEDPAAIFGTINLASTPQTDAELRASRQQSRAERMAKLGYKSKSSLVLLPEQQATDQTMRARTVLLALQPHAVYAAHVPAGVRAELARLCNDSDLDTQDSAEQLLARAHPMHPVLGSWLQLAFNALWLAVFQWDALLNTAERARHVCAALAAASQPVTWRPRLHAALSALGIPHTENDKLLLALLNKMADIILRARVEAVVGALSQSELAAAAVAAPEELSRALCDSFVTQDIAEHEQFLTLHEHAASEPMRAELHRRACIVATLRRLTATSITGGQRRVECVPALYLLAEQLDRHLLEGLGTAPAAAAVTVTLAELLKSMPLLRAWTAMVRAGCEPAHRLAPVDEFRLYAAFVQRLARGLVVARRKAQHVSAALLPHDSAPVPGATALQRCTEMMRSSSSVSENSMP